MKKLLSAMLAACLMLMCASNALASFDASAIASDEYCVIDVDSDGDAFITSDQTVPELSFVHELDSEYKYSYAWFDILALDFNTNSPLPIFRLWMMVYNDIGYFDIDSVTMTVGSTEYTFSGISKPERYTDDGTSYGQKLLIIFGDDNLSFLTALEEYLQSFNNYKELESGFAVPVVFHGTRDIKGTLDVNFGFEWSLFHSWIIDSNTIDYFGESSATAMTTPPPQRVNRTAES